MVPNPFHIQGRHAGADAVNILRRGADPHGGVDFSPATQIQTKEGILVFVVVFSKQNPVSNPCALVAEEPAFDRELTGIQTGGVRDFQSLRAHRVSTTLAAGGGSVAVIKLWAEIEREVQALRPSHHRQRADGRQDIPLGILESQFPQFVVLGDSAGFPEPHLRKARLVFCLQPSAAGGHFVGGAADLHLGIKRSLGKIPQTLKAHSTGLAVARFVLQQSETNLRGFFDVPLETIISRLDAQAGGIGWTRRLAPNAGPVAVGVVERRLKIPGVRRCNEDLACESGGEEKGVEFFHW